MSSALFPVNSYNNVPQNYSYNYAPVNGNKNPAVELLNKERETKDTEKVKNTGCQTCQNRKYIDGSNEGDVSFQTPGHIAPESSAMIVSSHEREHVANAVQKASEPNAKLVSASVRLISSVCPECGRSYIAGGVTNTVIQYRNSTPYDQVKKSMDALSLRGANIDYAI